MWIPGEGNSPQREWYFPSDDQKPSRRLRRGEYGRGRAGRNEAWARLQSRGRQSAVAVSGFVGAFQYRSDSIEFPLWSRHPARIDRPAGARIPRGERGVTPAPGLRPNDGDGLQKKDVIRNMRPVSCRKRPTPSQASDHHGRCSPAGIPWMPQRAPNYPGMQVQAGPRAVL